VFSETLTAPVRYGGVMRRYPPSFWDAVRTAIGCAAFLAADRLPAVYKDHLIHRITSRFASPLRTVRPLQRAMNRSQVHVHFDHPGFDAPSAKTQLLLE
jgi:hypothetical protein